MNLFPWIEELINQVMRRDSRTPKRLAMLEGRRCRIEIRDIHMAFDMVFLRERIHLTQSLSQIVDTTLRAPLSTFLVLSTSDKKSSYRAASLGLVIEGDMEVAKAIQTLFLTFSVDWEEELSGLTGDIVAHQWVTYFRKIRQKKHAIVESLAYSISDYLQEGALPSPVEVDNFLQQVDRIRSDIDRMENRIRLLEDPEMPCVSELSDGMP